MEFMDIPASDDFFSDEEPEAIQWHEGDTAYHDTFGEGKVIAVLDGGSIVQVNFYNAGIKSILSSHPKIHKVENGGFDA